MQLKLSNYIVLLAQYYSLILWLFQSCYNANVLRRDETSTNSNIRRTRHRQPKNTHIYCVNCMTRLIDQTLYRQTGEKRMAHTVFLYLSVFTLSCPLFCFVHHFCIFFPSFTFSPYRSVFPSMTDVSEREEQLAAVGLLIHPFISFFFSSVLPLFSFILDFL